MKSFLKLIRSKEAGQSLVETALTLPIFILILCGVLDFGWLFTNQLMLNNSSREAARTGVVNFEENNAAYQTLVINKAKEMIYFGDTSDPNVFNVTVTVNAEETDVTVQVDNTVPVLTPIVGAFFTNNQAELTSSTTMRIG
ncbi:MAG: TadE-like protein [Firmicutes bacterium ADurb.Bin182]|nr:MAG: TadE-like protein [Firmicutes bacterium ADurb.Bin182]